MAKNPTSEQFAAYVAARQNGIAAHVAQKEAGLSHSQAEFHWLRTQPVAEGGMAELVGATEATQANARKLREAGESWGRIAVHMNITEGQARKLFAEGTGLKSQGNRIGKGGRFYVAEPRLYTDTLKATGTAIRVDEKGHDGALAAADEMRELVSAEVDELRKVYAKEIGKAAPKGFTKAQLAIAIRRSRKA